MKNKIPLSIVSGFLGAGKTTFIKKLVQDVFADEKVIVLENEFGKIDLDSENLARDRILVESIRGGCICCSSSDMLPVSIQDLAERHRPDRIIIEPTGLAQLTDVLTALQEPYIQAACEIDHIITIVDARNFYSRISISKVFFENQIAASRVVFLSKTEGLQKAQLTEVSEAVLSINPFCEIVCDNREKLTKAGLEEVLAFSRYPFTPIPASSSGESTQMYQSFSYEGGEYMFLPHVRELFRGITDNRYGEVHRVKGIFQTSESDWYTCEYVPGETRIRRLEKNVESGHARLRICVIGLRLNSGQLRSGLLRAGMAGEKESALQ